jgi:signal transduction histidine kinase
LQFFFDYICRLRGCLRIFPINATMLVASFFLLIPVIFMHAADEVKAANLMVSDTLKPYIGPLDGLGSWVWAEKTYDGQICQLWRSFEIPEKSTVVRARLSMTVDNEFTLYLDGQELGQGAEWRELFIFDLAPLLTPGKHVLAVRGVNSFTEAGMLLGLEIELSDGRIINIKSDSSWRIVPADVTRWKKVAAAPDSWPAATIKQAFGAGPYWTAPASVNMMPTLQIVRIHFWQTGLFQITLLSVCGVVILISLRLMAQLALHQKERWLLQRERARIAREIHDDIGARMTLLVLHGEEAQNGLSNDSETSSKLVQICEEARGLLSTMDEILWAVNPRRDTLRDFAAYVCNYAQEFLKPTQIQCLFEVDPEMSATAFDLPLRRSLLMAIKETLNNAVKHSKATELRLQIKWLGQRLIVVVQDNGKGFDQAVIKSERNGLSNMAQRMNELGGSCVITSEPSQGCRVEFDIPLKHQQSRSWAWIWNAKQFSEQANETRNTRATTAAPNHDPANC